MLPEPSAANLLLLCDTLCALAGLALLGLRLFSPQTRTWRAASSRMPAWSLPVPETLLVSWVVIVAVFLGPLLAQSLLRTTPLALHDGWRMLSSLAGFHGAALAALAAYGAFVRRRGLPLPPASAAGADSVTIVLGQGFLLFCIVLAPVYGVSLLSNAVFRLLDWPVRAQDLSAFFAAADSRWLLLGLTVTGAVVAPLGEELIFRAGLFRLLRRMLPRPAAVALSALVFAALHQNAATFLPLAVLGALLALAYEKTGSLLVVVVAHGLFNLNSIAGIVSGLSDVS